MLQSLSIRDVVLIDRLDLAFGPHLSALTGETGAGKSILLDSLGLALGFRAESGMVRQGATQAVVIAAFDIAPSHPVWSLLADQGIGAEETVMLRRIVNPDGRSRGFINDQPVSIGLLKQVGETLVEIQGQFEQRGLLDPAQHRILLDGFGGYEAHVAAVRAAWRTVNHCRTARMEAEAAIKKARADETWLRQCLAELDQVRPEPGEETRLSEARGRLMHRAQIIDAVASAYHELTGDRGGERSLHSAARQLERVRAKAMGRLDEAIAALERALVELAEAAALLEAARHDDEDGDTSLDQVEDRLFKLRGLARKHGVAIDHLAALRDDIAQKLTRIEDGGTALKQLLAEEETARLGFEAAARQLSADRAAAASALDRAVMAELGPLKLDRARFITCLQPLPVDQWSADGAERVSFEVATNPGSAPGPIHKIASGGELSRFLLALKVVLARISHVPTIVFDEVDSGIGGAVAAAVGERLQRLGQELQVLVVTHSPQVAARAHDQWRVAKRQDADQTVTRVEPLDPDERREEIARMLSGAEITPEARAAADQLLARTLAA